MFLRFGFNFPSCIQFGDCGGCGDCGYSLATADSQAMSAFWTYVLIPKQSAYFKTSKYNAKEKNLLR